MKFGLEINDFNWQGGEAAMGRQLADIGRRAEEAGFDSIWVWDHFVQLRKWEDPLLEGWLMLAYLAGATERVKLGTLVTGVTYRYPAVLVKQATTLDVLSGGRAYLGIGAAWNEREHHAFGAPFPPLRERFQMLEDALQIAHRAWRGERGAFEGKQVQLTEQIDVPAPVSKPHPPILIGGGGEKKTLKLVAKYGDATHCGSGPENFRHKMEVLRAHCEEVGRDFEEIERCTSLDVSPPGRRPGMADPGLLVERVGELEEAGAQALFFALPDAADSDSIERFGRGVISQAG
ncbi:MAG: LLM class F420-dependent oxidoreductase [Chloroflexi bacterium]|nr:LLM class F420-dependent oxidoreductase [Chloroflexota bacterium]